MKLKINFPKFVCFILILIGTKTTVGMFNSEYNCRFSYYGCPEGTEMYAYENSEQDEILAEQEENPAKQDENPAKQDEMSAEQDENLAEQDEIPAEPDENYRSFDDQETIKKTSVSENSEKDAMLILQANYTENEEMNAPTPETVKPSEMFHPEDNRCSKAFLRRLVRYRKRIGSKNKNISNSWRLFPMRKFHCLNDSYKSDNYKDLFINSDENNRPDSSRPSLTSKPFKRQKIYYYRTASPIHENSNPTPKDCKCSVNTDTNSKPMREPDRRRFETIFTMHIYNNFYNYKNEDENDEKKDVGIDETSEQQDKMMKYDQSDIYIGEHPNQIKININGGQQGKEAIALQSQVQGRKSSKPEKED